MSTRFFRCLPTVKQGNLAQQIARALNKLPDKIAFVNIGGGVTPPPPPPPPGVTPLYVTSVKGRVSITKTRLYSQGDGLSGSVYYLKLINNSEGNYLTSDLKTRTRPQNTSYRALTAGKPYGSFHCVYLAATFLASALKRGIHPPGTLNFNLFSGGDGLSLGHLLRTLRTEEIPCAKLTRSAINEANDGHFGVTASYIGKDICLIM